MKQRSAQCIETPEEWLFKLAVVRKEVGSTLRVAHEIGTTDTTVRNWEKKKRATFLHYLQVEDLYERIQLCGFCGSPMKPRLRKRSKASPIIESSLVKNSALDTGD